MHDTPGPRLRPIVIRGARTHNLKGVDLSIAPRQLTVITGVSGSGKSSLAFDTIYAEGQRRYVESLSAYARQFLELMEKPDVDLIEGLSPAIAIEQKAASHNPRSTVGTVTEIHDYLRLLFARVGDPQCPDHGVTLAAQSVSQMVDQVMSLPEETRVMILSPLVVGRKGEQHDLIEELIGREAHSPRVFWYYTPMAMAFTSDLECDLCVYDNMDELSLFRGASQELLDLENALFARCDLVFTGGMSLYEAKRHRHRSVHGFPSSGGFSDHFDIGVLSQDQPEALADDRVIIREQDSDSALPD